MANKNVYFKHSNTASQGHTLSTLWANGDTEAIALFWLLLELVSRFESYDSADDARGKIIISWSVLARETNWKPSKCRRVLSRIVPVSEIEMEDLPEGYVSFRVRNWLKYQETRGAKKTEKTVGTILSNKDLRLKDVVDVGKKTQTPTPPAGSGVNSALRFESRFHPDAEKFVEGLRVLGIEGSLRNNLPELLQRFAGYEEFRDWANGLLGSAEKKKFDSNAERARWITAAVKSEIGAVP